MKVTLIITTYNNPSALKKVTDSILNQTRLPDEVIIADDGSDENTAQGVESFSKDASFPVLHVYQEHKGFRAAKIRNEAIKQSSGDYIIFLDGDCIVNRYFISDHLLLAEKGYFIQGKRILVSKEVEPVFTYEQANSFMSLISMALTGKISNVHHLIRLPPFFSIKNKKLKGIKSCNMSFFRNDILAVNGFNEDFIGWGREDSELAARLFNYGLMRKEHPFVAICFHIWHPHYPMDTLTVNDAILQRTINSGEYFCINGIIKK